MSFLAGVVGLTGRRHRSQSPASFESPVGLCDAPVPCEAAAECEGAEVDIPDAIIDFLKTDIVPGAGG
jgi:hypothetical protein